jgi:predicted lipoprotein with Yx(FWY)xxD motif
MSPKLNAAILVLAALLSAAATTAAGQSTFTINISTNADVGQYLVDGKGLSLYYFANDTPGESTCADTPYNQGGILLKTVPNTSTCATVRPAFYAPEISVPSGLNKADFTTIDTAGRKQTALRGWPLYHYLGDNVPGDINGDGAVKGQWVLAKPFGTLRAANNPAVGAYLTDARRMTLYYYKNDKGSLKNTCTDDCASKWPAFFAGPIDIASSELNRNDFSQFIKDDNYQQTTFMDWPLYYYFGDKKPGDMNGQGFGGVWSAATLNITANPVPGM